MGYRFIVSEGGHSVGILMVADGGAGVWFRTDGPGASPNPVTSPSTTPSPTGSAT
jgi:hypothetical protein